MGCMYLAKAEVGVQWLLYRQDSRYWINLIEAYRYLFNFHKALNDLVKSDWCVLPTLKRKQKNVNQATTETLNFKVYPKFYSPVGSFLSVNYAAAIDLAIASVPGAIVQEESAILLCWLDWLGEHFQVIFF